MKKIIAAAIILFTFFHVQAQQLSPVTGTKNLTCKIIPSENKTWGYDIYNKGKLLIHQPSIPALPGNAGFSTKADAGKVAKKVMEKIDRGEYPPSVSIEEMKELGVIPK
jgi:hypothetical protein